MAFLACINSSKYKYKRILCWGGLQNGEKWAESGQKWLKMGKNGQRWVKSGQNELRMPIMGQKWSKWAKMSKNGQKWAKMFWNGANLSPNFKMGVAKNRSRQIKIWAKRNFLSKYEVSRANG